MQPTEHATYRKHATYRIRDHVEAFGRGEGNRRDAARATFSM